MKILILGEYSGFVMNLTIGLLQRNDVEVIVFAQSDGYKSIKQIVETYSYKENKNISILGLEIRKSFLLRNIPQYFKFKKDISQYKNYFDAVLIINPEFIRLSFWIFQPLFSITDIDYVKKNNAKVFLSACGFDSVNNDYFKRHYPKIAKFIGSTYDNFINRKVNRIVMDYVDGIIPVSYLYAISYRESMFKNKLSKTILLPFDCKSVPYSPNTLKEKIVIFNGVLRPWKGQEYTNDALKMIKDKYGDRIEVVYERKPYNEFIKSLSSINIYIDQCGISYGVAALIAMSAGCITFSGNPPECEMEYRIEDIPIVHMPYDVKEIVSQLSWWIEHPNELEDYGLKSRKYVEEHHNPQIIADMYLKQFTGSN